MFHLNEEDRTVSVEEFTKVFRLLLSSSAMEEETAKRIATEIAWERGRGKKNRSFREFVEAHHHGKILNELWFRFFP